MAVDAASLTIDLADEQAALDAVVATLPETVWSQATPSPGWTIADQIGHLTYFDGTATTAITDPGRFVAERDALLQEVIAEGADMDEATLGPYRAMSPSELLVAWRANRASLLDAAGGLSDDDRIEWYGPSMGAKSFLTARLMETWAHGQDVVDGAREAGHDVSREPTDRLRHIAQLGVITRGWSYQNRGLAAPAVEVRVELAAPSGEAWVWGPDTAEESITGPAEDFCLVVTQRRHPHDTDLVIVGEAARDWMLRAQAFAGGATDGPPPRAAA